MRRILLVAGWLVSAVIAASAQSRLVDLPDGGLAVVFNGVQVRLAERGGSVTGAPRIEDREKRDYWETVHIRKDRSAFETWLSSKTNVSFVANQAFDPAVFTAEIAYPVAAKKHRSDTPDHPLRSSFIVIVTIDQDKEGRWIENWRRDMRSLDDLLARHRSGAADPSGHASGIYTQDGFEGVRFGRGADYPPRSDNKLPAHLRRFRTDKPFFSRCDGGAGLICIWNTWSINQRVIVQIQYSALWSLRSWIEFDGHINSYMKTLFPASVPEGIQ